MLKIIINLTLLIQLEIDDIPTCKMIKSYVKEIEDYNTN